MKDRTPIRSPPIEIEKHPLSSLLAHLQEEGRSNGGEEAERAGDVDEGTGGGGGTVAASAGLTTVAGLVASGAAHDLATGQDGLGLLC